MQLISIENYPPILHQQYMDKQKNQEQQIYNLSALKGDISQTHSHRIIQLLTKQVSLLRSSIDTLLSHIKIYQQSLIVTAGHLQIKLAAPQDGFNSTNQLSQWLLHLTQQMMHTINGIKQETGKIQVPVFVEKQVIVERVIQKAVQVIVQRPIFVERIIQVDRPVFVEKIVEKIIEKPITIQRIVEVERIIEVEKIVEVQKPIFVQRVIEVDRPVFIQKVVEMACKRCLAR